MIVQVGQCGNQLGRELWQLAAHDAGSAWYDQEGFARCVAIDSEPRVLSDSTSTKACKIRSSNRCYGSGDGCANVWAAGFAEHALLDSAMEAIRREAERSRWVPMLVR